MRAGRGFFSAHAGRGFLACTRAEGFLACTRGPRFFSVHAALGPMWAFLRHLCFSASLRSHDFRVVFEVFLFRVNIIFFFIIIIIIFFFL
eukprot:SAG11_NODE_94_length_17057_cov_255.471754_9_plen_90_part_00